jgi:hypothetical protein
MEFLGKFFIAEEGLSKGILFLLFFFVLAADFLQTILNNARRHNHLSLTLPLPHDEDFPILQYADDTLIFMKGDITELNHLKELLHTFAESTGLMVNFDKSMMVPINIAEDRFDVLVTTFGCTKGSLLFTYLGLPLSLAKPTVADFWPLVSECERRFVAFSSYLSEAGRLEFTNAVLTALPTFAMSSFLLPKTVIKQIDKCRKHCLCKGSDISSKKPSKAAWPLVCLPKPEGGLGVLNLSVQNESLLLKHLHKFYNRAPIPWVQLVWTRYYSRNKLPVTGVTFRGSFWWRDILKLTDQFKGIAMVSVRDGKSCFLWHDLWDGRICSQAFP